MLSYYFFVLDETNIEKNAQLLSEDSVFDCYEGIERLEMETKVARILVEAGERK